MNSLKSHSKLNSIFLYSVFHLVFILRIIADQAYLDLSHFSYLISGIALFFLTIPFILHPKFKFNILIKYLFLTIIGYIIISILNFSLFKSPFHVTKEILRFINFLLLGLLTYNFPSRKHIDNIFIFYFILLALIGLCQFFGFIKPTHIIDNIIRIDSLLGHPNAFGNFLAILGFYFLYRYYITYKKIYLIYFFISFCVIFTTQSRTSILLLLFFTFTFFTFIYLKFNHISIFKKSILFILLFIGIVISIYLLRNRFLNELILLFDQNISLTSVIDDKIFTGSIAWRLFNWYMLLSYVFDNNLLFGVGLSLTSTLNQTITGVGLEAHNDYVKYIFELGLIGAISIILINLFVIIKLINYSKYFIQFKFLLLILLGLTIFKFFDGLEQSNILMYCFICWGNILLKR